MKKSIIAKLLSIFLCLMLNEAQGQNCCKCIINEEDFYCDNGVEFFTCYNTTYCMDNFGGPGISARPYGWASSPCSEDRCDFIRIILPVKLLEFKAARPADRVVILHWTTASETNNKGFQVQRSQDGITWKGLAFLPGQGTTQEQHTYSYIDKSPFLGLNYYRLQQVDYDGDYEYSRIISVEADGKGGGFLLFPNPASDRTTLSVEPVTTGEAMLILYNSVGQPVIMQRLQVEPGPFS